MGFKFQFVTLAGFHSLNSGMFELARAYRDEGMAAYTRLQEKEFAMEKEFGFARHQAPELCRRQLLRRSSAYHHRRHRLDHRHARLHRGGAVRQGVRSCEGRVARGDSPPNLSRSRLCLTRRREDAK
jgi:hypothetical protein